jgi:hypothetical protein
MAGRDDHIREGFADSAVQHGVRPARGAGHRRRVEIAVKRFDLDPVVGDADADVIGDARLRVARQQPEVDAGFGYAGQHVVLVAGVEHGQRRRGLHHRGSGAALGEFAQQQRPE